MWRHGEVLFVDSPNADSRRGSAFRPRRPNRSLLTISSRNASRAVAAGFAAGRDAQTFLDQFQFSNFVTRLHQRAGRLRPWHKAHDAFQIALGQAQRASAQAARVEFQWGELHTTLPARSAEGAGGGEHCAPGGGDPAGGANAGGVKIKAMQHRRKMTTAEAERMFCVKIVGAPPPLRVEAVDKPPLAAIAPDPPSEPIPPTAPAPAPPSPPPAPAQPKPPTAAEAHAASVREAAIARRRKASAKPRMAAPVPPPVATPPHDTRH